VAGSLYTFNPADNHPEPSGTRPLASTYDTSLYSSNHKAEDQRVETYKAAAGNRFEATERQTSKQAASRPALVMSYHLSLSLGQAPASHPHLLIALPDSEPASRDRFHVSFTLPDSIFVDRDELIDIWGQGAGSRVQWALTPDKIDIERPITNATERSNLRVGWSEGQLDVPLHVRYLEPNDVGPEVVTLFQEHDVKAGWSCVGLGGKPMS